MRAAADRDREEHAAESAGGIGDSMWNPINTQSQPSSGTQRAATLGPNIPQPLVNKATNQGPPKPETPATGFPVLRKGGLSYADKAKNTGNANGGTANAGPRQPITNLAPPFTAFNPVIKPLTSQQLDEPKTTRAHIITSAAAALGITLSSKARRPQLVSAYKAALQRQQVSGTGP